MPRAGSESVISVGLRVGGGPGAGVRSSITLALRSRSVARAWRYFIPRGGPKALRDAESGLLGSAAIVDVTDDAARG